MEKEPNEGSTPRPNMLDIVKIDGKWAQVVSSDKVKYLSDRNSVAEVDWDKYTYQRDFNFLTAVDLVDRSEISDSEFMVIYWGTEQEKNPDIRRNVTVFGIFTKK